MQPRVLDLFCGAGGVAMGLHRAGFTVLGVDIVPQPRYPFAFRQADALEYVSTVRREDFDLVWASPPCQRYTMFARNIGTAANHWDSVPPTREALVALGLPYVIENVPGAPLREATLLCGSMFGLGVRRHRLFETSFAMRSMAPSCNHSRVPVPVYGHGSPQWHRKNLGRNIGIAEKREAMGIDWMNRDELSQAIPPAFSEWIGRQALVALEVPAQAFVAGRVMMRIMGEVP